MRFFLYTLSVAMAILSVFELIADGPYGEIEAGLAAVCFCVLVVGIAVLRELEHRKQ